MAETELFPESMQTQFCKNPFEDSLMMLAHHAGDDKSIVELIEATNEKSIEESNARAATKKQAFSRFKY